MTKFSTKVCAACGLGLAVALFCLAGCGKDQDATKGDSNPSGGTTERVHIGFLVKQPEEAWFQYEWKYAQQAADKNHFDLIKMPATDDEQVLAAIDSLAALHAQGFIICPPDVNLGPAIVNRAKANHLKVMSVDDRFIEPDGTFMTEVPYMGIAAHEIGEIVGKALYAEMIKRGWKKEETAACVVTYEELHTARERTNGAIDMLHTSGFPREKIYKGAEKTTNIPGGFDAADAVLEEHLNVKKWLVCSMNDEAVLGAIGALKKRGIPAENMICIGIGGTPQVIDFKSPKMDGFYATVLINWKRHGYETSNMMYHWIKDDTVPPTATYTGGILVTRENYERILKEQGSGGVMPGLSGFTMAQAIYDYRHDDDAAGDHHLIRIVHAQLRAAVADHGHDECTNDGAECRTLATTYTGAADENRGNDVQFHAGGGRGVSFVVKFYKLHHPCNARKGQSHHVDHDFGAVHGHTA